ncbi:MAG: hypothetical protein HOP07_18640 [Bacteriovoracaceae bacterium]|nr:hypothetical protein [Bacteriovoracaceae bacterium]
MDLEVLKKKLSAFKGDGGRTRNVSDELLLEILSAWEHFSGPARDFYKALGVSQKGISSMLGKAKRLKREGATMPFSEVKIDGISNIVDSNSVLCDIEVTDNNKVIRFRKVDLLIEYLKKVA